MRKIIIIDHGRHDMYEMIMEHKQMGMGGASLVDVINRLIRKFADDDFKKMMKMVELLNVKFPECYE